MPGQNTISLEKFNIGLLYLKPGDYYLSEDGEQLLVMDSLFYDGVSCSWRTRMVSSVDKPFRQTGSTFELLRILISGRYVQLHELNKSELPQELQFS